jgi:hypothetical protein
VTVKLGGYVDRIGVVVVVVVVMVVAAVIV